MRPTAFPKECARGLRRVGVIGVAKQTECVGRADGESGAGTECECPLNQ